VTPLKIGYTSIRILLIFVFAVALFHSFQMLNSSAGLQQAKVLLDSLYKIPRSDFGQFRNLLDQLDQLDAKAVPAGSYTGIKAHARSLAWSRTGGASPVSELEVRDSYITALEFNPHDGYLWAKLAFHLSRLEGVNQPMLAALDSAMRLARNDYNTFKVLLEIAIRDWPRFDCSYKEKMLGVVNDSLHVDDRLLSRWNGERGHMKIDGYVTSLMGYYSFDPLWAVNEVNQCRRNQHQQEG
jgi:hypothetical protein